MRRTAVLLLAVAAVALPLSKSYDIVPYKNCIGTAPGGAQFGVSQYIRNTLAELTRVSVWIGDTIDTSSFSVQFRDSITDSVGVSGTQYLIPDSTGITAQTAGQRTVAGGVYFCQVQTDTERQQKKVVLTE